MNPVRAVTRLMRRFSEADDMIGTTVRAVGGIEDKLTRAVEKKEVGSLSGQKAAVRAKKEQKQDDGQRETVSFVVFG